VLYDKMREPPRYGSLLEVLCLIIWKHRQSLMVASVRAQAQAAIGGDAAVDAFKEFKSQVNRIEIEDQENKMRSALKDWSKVPEIRFKPVAPLGTAPSLPSTIKSSEVDAVDEHKEAIRRVLSSSKLRPLPRNK
jgi:hypothetical protein